MRYRAIDSDSSRLASAGSRRDACATAYDKLADIRGVLPSGMRTTGPSERCQASGAPDAKHQRRCQHDIGGRAERGGIRIRCSVRTRLAAAIHDRRQARAEEHDATEYLTENFESVPLCI